MNCGKNIMDLPEFSNMPYIVLNVFTHKKWRYKKYLHFFRLSKILFFLLFFLSRSSLVCSSGFLARTTNFLLGFLCSEHVFVVVNKFHHAHFCVITQTVSCSQYAGISTWSVTNLNNYITEKLGYSFLVLEVAENNPAVVSRVVLCLSDQRFDINSQSLCLCNCREYTLMQNQRRCHIRQQSLSVCTFSS